MGTIKRNFYNNITPTGKFDSADLTGTIPATNVADASLTNVTSVPASVGDLVQKVASDPTPVGAGDVWYNTTSNALKSVVLSQAWSSGAPLSVGRQTGGGFGTQTAGVLAGGNYGSPPTLLGVTNTEEYNGSGWSPSGNLSTARRYLSGAAGTQTSGIVFGGFDASPGATAATEEYDGSTWTSGGNLVNARGNLGGSGTQTAALGVGGTGRVAFSEEYNGTSWSEGNNLNTGRSLAASSKNGLQTASLVFGGSSAPGAPGTSADTESYDGTSWTTVNSMNQAKDLSTGAGTQTAALSFGGYDGSSTINNTESWDGTNWSTAPTLGSPNNQHAGTGLQTAALSIGGSSPLTATEEYNVSTNLITAAAWASANSQSVPSYNRSGWGTAEAGWLAGGGYPSVKTDTEEYDGTNWTSGGSLNTARGAASVGGSQTAAIFASGSRNTAVELYDGSTWTSTTSIPTIRNAAGGGGTQTSLVVFGGTTAGAPTYPISTAVEEWNGSAWTTGTSLPSVRGSMNGSAFGTSSDDVFSAGGVTAPAPGAIPHSVTSETLSYNGTTWTEEADILTARASPYAFGTSGSAIIAGGDTNNSGATSVLSEQWNGTSWSTNPSIATARYTGGRAGTSSSGWIGGGYPGNDPSSSATEEFTGETVAANIVEITTS